MSFLQQTLTSLDKKRRFDGESLRKEIKNVSFFENTLESISPFFGFCSSAYWLMPRLSSEYSQLGPAPYLSVATELAVHFQSINE